MSTKRSKVISGLTAIFALLTVICASISYKEGAPAIFIAFIVLGAVILAVDLAYICAIPRRLLNLKDIHRAELFSYAMVLLGSIGLIVGIVAIAKWGWAFRSSKGTQHGRYHINVHRLALSYEITAG